jgi:hypothetical protein
MIVTEQDCEIIGNSIIHDELVDRIRQFRATLNEGVNEGKVLKGLLGYFEECFPESKEG